jgi:hypothetical protein
MAWVAGPRPAWVSTHPVPSSGPGCPARPVSGPPGVRSARCPVRPVSNDLGSSSGIRRPAVRCPPLRCPAVWGRPVRPDVSVWSPSGDALGTGRCGKQPAPRERAQVPVGCRVVERLGSTAEKARTRATPPRSPMVGGLSVADPGRRPRLTLASQAGRRAERPSPAAARGHGRRLHRPRGCRSRDGWATTVRGCRGACRPPGRARRGRWACRRGWACGPSAAQAASERSRLAANSALTCDDGWWACQDLNLGPHPYQQNAGNRCAKRRSRRLRSTVGVEGMCSIGPLVCVHPSWR